MSDYPRRRHSHHHRSSSRRRSHAYRAEPMCDYGFGYGYPAPMYAPPPQPQPVSLSYGSMGYGSMGYGGSFYPSSSYPSFPVAAAAPEPTADGNNDGNKDNSDSKDDGSNDKDGNKAGADDKKDQKEEGDGGKDGKSEATHHQQHSSQGLFRMTGESPVMSRPSIGPVVIPTRHSRGGSAFVVRNIGRSGARDARRIPHSHYAEPLRPYTANDINSRISAATTRRNEHLEHARQRAHMFTTRVPMTLERRAAMEAERRQHVAARVAVTGMVADANRQQYLGEIRGHAHEEMVRASEHAARAVYAEYRHAEAVDMGARSRERHAVLRHDQQLRARSMVAHQLAGHPPSGWHHQHQGPVYTHAATATTTTQDKPAAAAAATAATAGEGETKAEEK